MDLTLATLGYARLVICEKYDYDSNRLRIFALTEFARDEKRQRYAYGNRQYGRDRGPGGSLLGRADRTIADAFRDRARPDAAIDRPRVRRAEEGCGRGESRSRTAPGGQ